MLPLCAAEAITQGVFRGQKELPPFWLRWKQYAAPERGSRALKPTAFNGGPFSTVFRQLPYQEHTGPHPPNKDLEPGSPPSYTVRLSPSKGKTRGDPAKEARSRRPEALGC
ncbi:hypothetical protein HPB50_021614 [Hyalomma asiaticum]|uniref:Uncharacterized protein n=1 Tax=Hyalomma asiaticum TaxID=266040 RepID=A0ACB7T0F4_HYAAI|nr:hypothetical protein HPB50_021614 [Hyalomma asiaticum]